MKCSVISIDLAKNVFQICALSNERTVLFNKKVKRSNLLHELRQFEPTLVVMEACYSSNPWGRRIKKLGHTVKCIPAFAVKPFVIGNKNDNNDALAIAEASFRPTLRFIPIKPIEQQDVQSLHKIRELLIKQRGAWMNQLRGLLAEYGEVLPKGIAHIKRQLPLILEDSSNELTPVSRGFITRIALNIRLCTKQITDIETELQQLLASRNDYQRLLKVPGVGPIVASALLAYINDIHCFKNGRQFAAWVGLTPRQYASGDTNRLGKISKRGNRTLRKLLIHGARAILSRSSGKDDRLSQWMNGLKERMHPCKCTVALANKLARIIWVVLARKTEFQASKACA